MGLVQTVPPATEPISLSEAKLHCRVDGDAEDAKLTALIVAARSMAENQTCRALVTQQWTQMFDAFPMAAIAIDKSPLISVQSVKYYDAAGVLQTLSASTYTVHTSGIVGLVAPIARSSWPETQARREAVEIAFTAGFGNATAVPQEIKLYMLLQIAHWYKNREAAGETMDSLPFVDTLLDPYRLARC